MGPRFGPKRGCLVNPQLPEERRQEPRYAASGSVTFRRTTALADTIVGTLVDTSGSGFRCRHNCLALASGQEVTFQFDGRSGKARVAWVRIVGGEAEAGFQVLSPRKAKG